MQQTIRGYFTSSLEQPALSHRVLLVGAPGSGRTTLLDKLRLADSPTPTAFATTTTLTAFGATAEMITTDGRHLSVWDLGIPRQAGVLRHHIGGYEDGTVSIVCVVDSTNVLQLEETKAWLLEIYEEYGTILGEAVLLVFANKQDRTDAMSVVEVKDRMELDVRVLSRRWHIQGSFATTGEGVSEGISWLAAQLEEPLSLAPPHPMFSSIINFVSSFKAALTSSSPTEEGQKVIMLGLSGAGKTSILYRLVLDKIVLTTYTHGFNKEVIQLSPSHKWLTIWDHSGAWGNVRFWHQLLDDDRVPVIFVVDSTEPRDFDEVKRALTLTYRCKLKESTRFGVLLVMCNKQDCPNAVPVDEIRDQLGLNEIWQWGRRWHICGVSAMTGDGVWDGMEWLETQLTGPALPSPFLRTE